MTDTADMPSRQEEMLARLAELDLAAAEKAHAKLMAAEETSEITELGRTYQRLARSLRQTLALNARLARERAAATAGAKVPPPRAPEWPYGPLQRLTPPVRAHVDRVHAAVMRFVEREAEASDSEGFYETEAYEILIDLAAEEGFLDGPPDILAVRTLEIMGLRTPSDAPSAPPQDVPADPDSS